MELAPRYYRPEYRITIDKGAQRSFAQSRLTGFWVLPGLAYRTATLNIILSQGEDAHDTLSCADTPPGHAIDQGVAIHLG